MTFLEDENEENAVSAKWLAIWTVVWLALALAFTYWLEPFTLDLR